MIAYVVFCLALITLGVMAGSVLVTLLGVWCGVAAILTVDSED